MNSRYAMDQVEMPKIKYATKEIESSVDFFVNTRKLAIEIYDKRHPGKRKKERDGIRVKGEKV